MKLRKIRQRTHLASRPWTPRERFIVWRGLTGRFAIAIEPLLGMLFFGLLAWGVVWRLALTKPHDLWILSPLFALASLAFAVYFIAVMVAPFIAYAQTYKPIYTLDGYVRYRGPDEESDLGSAGYVAVLFEDREHLLRMGMLRNEKNAERDSARTRGVFRIRRHPQNRRQVHRRAAG